MKQKPEKPKMKYVGIRMPVTELERLKRVAGKHVRVSTYMVDALSTYLDNVEKKRRGTE